QKHETEHPNAAWTALAGAGLPSGLARYHSATALVCDAQDTLYVAYDGLGIFQSSDQGATWKALNHGLNMKTVHALALNANGELIAAGAVDERSEGSFGCGVLPLGNEQWQAAALQTKGTARFGCFCLDSQGRVLAGATGAMYRSEDGGRTYA